MRKTISTATLILALSCLTYAGEMQNGITGTTSTAQGVIQNGDDGDMPNGAPGEMQTGVTGTSSQSSIDGLEVTFNLMQSLLGLF